MERCPRGRRWQSRKLLALQGAGSSNPSLRHEPVCGQCPQQALLCSFSTPSFGGIFDDFVEILHTITPLSYKAFSHFDEKCVEIYSSSQVRSARPLGFCQTFRPLQAPIQSVHGSPDVSKYPLYEKVLCPSHIWICFMDIPFVSNRLAQECLRS